MIVTCTRSNYLSEDTDALAELRRRALRDAVICIGWLKLISVIYYIFLYYLVHAYSVGCVSTVIQVMLLVAIPFQILHGTLLFYGALDNKVTPLEVGLWLCLMISSYNTVLGTIGCIYFIRTGHVFMHFLLAFSFIMLAFSLFTVLCHDILMVYAYKQIISQNQDQSRLDAVQSNQ